MAFIFDVEGTLVDSVPAQLRSWRNVLVAHGHDVSLDTLQAYSGMDGNDMLKAIVPDLDETARKTLMEAQDGVYAATYLRSVRPFPGMRDALRALRDGGARLSLATTCQGPSLEHYRALMAIDDLLSATACGEDVDEGKPDPGLVARAMEKLGTGPQDTFMVPRAKGAIFFTGATASLRGGPGYAAFASAKFGLRAVAQSMARELWPQGVHVAHLVIDSGVDTAFVRDRIRASEGDGALENLDPDRLMPPSAIGDAYWQLYAQPRSAWVFEQEIRPFGEKW